MDAYREYIFELMLNGTMDRKAANAMLAAPANSVAPTGFGTVVDKPVEVIREIGRLLCNGQKIHAVKVFKDEYRVDLRTAKATVEAIAELAFPHGI